MRKNQVTINIERFGTEAPKGKMIELKQLLPESLLKEYQVIHVYCDSGNDYEELAGIYYQTFCEIMKYKEIPSFGRRQTQKEQRTDYARHDEIMGALKNESEN